LGAAESNVIETALKIGKIMKKTTYGTGATTFSDGSSRMTTTLGKKKSRVRKKRKKKY